MRFARLGLEVRLRESAPLGEGNHVGALGVSLLYIFSPWHTTRVSHESSPQEFSTRMSAPQKKSCVSCKSVPQDRATKGVPQVQTLPHKIAHKSVPQKLSTRVSYKSVPQECCARAFHKSGPRECPMFPSPNGTCLLYTSPSPRDA